MAWSETTLRDIRYAVRRSVARPGVSCAAILTLAVGIGLDAGVFGVLNGMLFRPRVELAADRFVHLVTSTSGFTLADYDALRRMEVLTEFSAWSVAHVALESDAATNLSLLVSCNFFSLYGLDRPMAGRTFSTDECNGTRSNAVVIVSEQVWRTRFHSDPHLVGTTVRISGEPFAVVGILPAKFPGRLRGPGIWIPFSAAGRFYGGVDPFTDKALPWLTVEGRLHDGQSRAQARAALQTITRSAHTPDPRNDVTLSVTSGALIEEPAFREAAVWVVPLVLGALGFVVLIACGNVSALLLSRATERRHEFAVRLALGATTGQLARMVLTESLGLSIAATPIAALLAWMVPRVFEALVPGLPYYPLRPDVTVLVYLGLTSAGAGLIAGVAPALNILRRNMDGSWGIRSALAGDGRRFGSREMLVTAQIAMSVVLLAGAVMIARAGQRVGAADYGFDLSRVLVVPLRPPNQTGSRPSGDTPAARMIERVRRSPGVLAVATTSLAPLDAGESPEQQTTFQRLRSDSVVHATVFRVSESFFETLGVPVMRGKSLDGLGRVNGSAAVISNSMARQLWGDGDPIGEQLTGREGESLLVVGVTRDLPRIGSKGASPVLYRIDTTGTGQTQLLVRFAGDPATVSSAIVDASEREHLRMPATPRTLQTVVTTVTDRLWVTIGMIGFLGLTGVCLTVIAIYAGVAFTVRARMKEIGVRMALGASRGHIVRLVFASAGLPITAGLGSGLLMAFMAAPALTKVFAGAPITLDPRDPVAYVAVAGLLTLAGLSAAAGPARLATRSNPMTALRLE